MTSPPPVASSPNRTPAADLVGWREWVTLPALAPLPLVAKVDTGAQTSSLHAPDLEIDDRSEPPLVRFTFHPDRERSGEPVPVTVPIVDQREVRSSNGEAEVRPVIRTTVSLGGQTNAIDLTLTCREQMQYRMLLGRRFLQDRYRVDPGGSFLLTGS
jgi:hypothetical protein